MIKQTINLLSGSRFALKIPTNRQVLAWIRNLASIVPTRHAIHRFRSGTNLGRIARHIFGHEQINKILGTNLALAVLATSAFQLPSLTQIEQFEAEAANQIINTDTLALITKKGVRLPTAERKLTQGYTIFHPGIDLDGVTGDPVWPIMDGFIEATQYSGFAYGNAVIVNHGNGLTSLYAHLSKINVKTGVEVNTNTIIGLLGSTGRSSGDHLHLEVRDHGISLNPLSILPK